MQEDADQTKTPSCLMGKVALTPIEFASLFGREKTWAYRLLWGGKIMSIPEAGQILIPTSEVARFCSSATRFHGLRRMRK